MMEDLYVKIRQPEHNCKEFHSKSHLLIHLQRGVGQGRHGHGDRLDCPACVWALARSVTLDFGANFTDGFWGMPLPLRNEGDEKEYEAIQKRVARKEGGDGAGIGLVSFEEKKIYIATNYQADPRMKFFSWDDNTEEAKEFLTKGLCIEPHSNGRGKHKIRPFGAFIRCADKRRENQGYHSLDVPAPNEDIKQSLKAMGSLVEDIKYDSYAQFYTKLSPTALGFFTGIITGNWSGVHKELPLPENDALWRSRVHERKVKKASTSPKSGKRLRAITRFDFPSPEEIAEERISACKRHLAEELKKEEEWQKTFGDVFA